MRWTASLFLLLLAALFAMHANAGPMFTAPYLAIPPENIARGPEAEVDGASVLAAGDLNGDGAPDLLVGMPEDGTSVLLNHDGVFAHGGSGTYECTGSVALGDMDGDGIQDAAVIIWHRPWASYAHGYVALGRGDGTFEPRQEMDVPLSTRTLVLSDVDGDGVLDAVTLADDTVSVEYGNGDGTMGRRADCRVEGGSSSIAVGDLNGDGIADVVLTPGSSPVVTVLLGVRSGGFVRLGDYTSVAPGACIALSDIDGDGHLDAVVGGGPWFSILRGVGDGSLRLPVLIATAPKGAGSLAIGDFDGDGRPDILAFGVGALLNRGNEMFQLADSLPAPPWLQAVVTGDWNGDGHLDFAVTTGTIQAYYGNGDGTFGLGRASIPGAGSAIAVVDLNHDGKLDLAGPTVFLANGDGTYSAGGDATGAIAFVDLNGDGIPDVIGADFARLGYGDGTFGPALPHDADGSLVGTADLDRDGRTDLVFQSSVMLGNGDGSFQPRIDYLGDVHDFSYLTRIVGVADLNGDGIPDIAVAGECTWCGDPMTQVGVLAGLGDGTFRQDSIYGPVVGGCDLAAIGDVDGDGRADVIVGTDVHDQYWTGFSTFVQTPEGTLVPHGGCGAAGTASSVAIRDVNGDGKGDLLVVNNDLQAIGVMLSRGGGVFDAETDYGPSGRLIVGDMNGDGLPDLVEPDGRDAHIWFNRGAGAPSKAPQRPATPTPTALACYPNPARTVATIRFSTPAGSARVRVYDITGRLVTTLLDGAVTAGPHTVAWNRLTRDGHATPPGVYLCELVAAGQRSTSRIVTIER